MYESVAKLPCGEVTVAKLPCGKVTGNRLNDGLKYFAIEILVLLYLCTATVASLQKLEKMYGFRGSALSLMESYLTHCYQCTKIGDSKSRQRQINCGIPQGLSLGPLLLLLYVNDLLLVSQFSTALFADDLLLVLSDANLSRLENRVNIYAVATH